MLIALGAIAILYFTYWILVVEAGSGNRGAAPTDPHIAEHTGAGRARAPADGICLGFVEFDCGDYASAPPPQQPTDIAVARTHP